MIRLLNTTDVRCMQTAAVRRGHAFVHAIVLGARHAHTEYLSGVPIRLDPARIGPHDWKEDIWVKSPC